MIKNQGQVQQNDTENKIERRSSNYLWETKGLSFEPQKQGYSSVSTSHPTSNCYLNAYNAAPNIGDPQQTKVAPDRQNDYPSIHYSAPNFNELQFQNLAIMPSMAPVIYLQPCYPYYGYPAVDPSLTLGYAQPEYYPEPYKEPRRTSSWKPPESPNVYTPQPLYSSPQIKSGPYSNEEYVDSIMRPYENSKGDLKILEGKICILAHFQSGSRCLQKMLDTANPKLLEFFIKEVLLSDFTLYHNITIRLKANFMN